MNGRVFAVKQGGRAWNPSLSQSMAQGKALGIGTTKIYELIGTGKLRTIKLGRRTLIRTDSIRDLVDTLEAA